MEWNYQQGYYVDISSMPKYIPAMLKNLQHPSPKKLQYAPHQWFKPILYGSRLQMTPVIESDPLPPKGIRRVESIVGWILYHARALDSTMLPSLNDIGSKQASATTGTNKHCTMVDYAATYLIAKIRFYASDMNLQADSNVAYLVLPFARSHYAGYFISEH